MCQQLWRRPHLLSRAAARQSAQGAGYAHVAGVLDAKTFAVQTIRKLSSVIGYPRQDVAAALPRGFEGLRRKVEDQGRERVG